MKSYLVRLTISLGVIIALLIGVPVSFAQGPVEPPAVTATIAPGDSVTVTKLVTVPALPQTLDLVLIVDLTGSYTDDLPNIKAKAPEIFDAIRVDAPDSEFGLATFVDFPFNPWGADNEWAYQLNQNLTANRATWLAAVNAMTNLVGGDVPESQYEALYQAATGAGREMPPTMNGVYTDRGEISPGQNPTFRSTATKVIALTTDAPFHTTNDSQCSGDPGCPFGYPGADRNTTVNALDAAGIKIIAIKAPGSGSEMDDLAAATGGAVTTTDSSSSDIAEAILGALGSLTYDVTAVPVACDPLVVTFDPPMIAGAVAGSTVQFQETITVPAGIDPAALPPDGVINCAVDFYAGSDLIGSQELHITMSVNNAVPVDIKPGSCPNPFNLRQNGVMPVAVAGTADFDVSQIDPASIRLFWMDPAAGVAPLRWSFEDVTTPYLPWIDKPLDAYACNTLGADGYPDLTLKFDSPALAALLDGVQDGELVLISLQGNLKAEYGSLPFYGEDVVKIIKKK